GAEDEGGKLLRWWRYNLQPARHLAPEGYEAKELGSAVYAFQPADARPPEADKEKGKKDPDAPLVFPLQADQVFVPDVKGLGVPAARAALREAGLEAVPDVARVTPQDRVLAQEPGPGWRPPSAEGKLSVDTQVPEVTGLDYAAARAQVEAAGLLIRAEGGKVAGAVRSQDPRAGSRMQRGSTVAVTLAPGRGRVKVPDVAGLKLAD